jgi:hypothetical protein
MKTQSLREILPTLLIVGAIVFALESFLFGFAESYAQKIDARAESLQQTISSATQHVGTSSTPPLRALLQDAATVRRNFSNENPLAIHEHVMQRASNAGVEIESIEPARASTKLSKKDTKLSVQAYEINCVATFDSFVSFLLTLEQESPWIRILDWSIEPYAQQGKPTVKANLRFEQFFLDTNHLQALTLALQEDE